MTDASGAQIGTTMKYLPFGETLAGSVPTDKKFTGQRLDATGLYYYGARYYDATIGRFISADTMIPNFANPQDFNRYTYVLNNPLKYTDPSGHGPYEELMAAASKHEHGVKVDEAEVNESRRLVAEGPNAHTTRPKMPGSEEYVFHPWPELPKPAIPGIVIAATGVGITLSPHVLDYVNSGEAAVRGFTSDMLLEAPGKYVVSYPTLDWTTKPGIGMPARAYFIEDPCLRPGAYAVLNLETNQITAFGNRLTTEWTWNASMEYEKPTYGVNYWFGKYMQNAGSSSSPWNDPSKTNPFAGSH